MIEKDYPIIEGLFKYELRSLANKLGLAGHAKLSKEQLIRHIKSSCEPEDIRRALGELTWWEKHSKHVYSLIGLALGAASILITIHYGSVDTTELLYKEEETAKIISAISVKEASTKRTRPTSALINVLEDRVYGNADKRDVDLKARLTRNPHDADALTMLGLQEMTKVLMLSASDGSAANALGAFETAAKVDPTLADPYFGIGYVLLYLSLFDIADRGLFRVLDHGGFTDTEFDPASGTLPYVEPRWEFHPDRRNKLVLRAALEAYQLGLRNYQKLENRKLGVVPYFSSTDVHTNFDLIRGMLGLSPGGMQAGHTSWLFLTALSRVDGEAVDEIVFSQWRLGGPAHKACREGKMASCARLAYLYETGRVVDKDLAKAASLYEQTCASGILVTCVNLGVLLLGEPGVASDVDRAVRIFREACDNSEPSGCFNLGVLYYKGEGVDLDYKASARLYQVACADGHQKACFNLANMHRLGQGVPQDAERATWRYREGCNAGDLRSCSSWGAMFLAGSGGVEKDVARAIGLFRRACDGDVGDACAALGFLYQTGQGVEIDLARAAELFGKACNQDSPRACLHLGAYYMMGLGVEQDFPTAETLMRRSCDAGLEDGCTGLETLNQINEDVFFNEVEISEYFRRRCSDGDNNACSLASGSPTGQ